MIPEKSMMAVTSQWGEGKTFRMIPLTEDCPFLEVIYDPMSKALVLLTRLQKEGFHMVSKIDDNGEPIRSPKAAAGNPDPYKKERKALHTSHEAYITEKEEIISFVKLFLYNDSYDFQKFMVSSTIQPVKNPIITQ